MLAAFQPFARVATVVCLCFLSGCATTPVERMARYPELLEDVSPEQAAQIRQGNLDLGFTSNMVFLAVGAPSEVYRRQSEAGASEVWVYLRYARQSYPAVFAPYYPSSPYQSRYPYRRYGTCSDWYYEQEPYLILTFEKGKISEIEVRRK